VAGEHPQGGHLSLIELAISYVLYGGVGYLVAGWWGAGCGGALLTVLYARQLWWAVAPGERREVDGPDVVPAIAPDPAREAGA
jgi:hypothetical protein